MVRKYTQHQSGPESKAIPEPSVLSPENRAKNLAIAMKQVQRLYGKGKTKSVSLDDWKGGSQPLLKKEEDKKKNEEIVNETLAGPGHPDLKKLKRQYDRNEDNNDHSTNAVLLAKHFGTEAEHNTAKQHLANRDRLGHGSEEGSKFQYDMSKKYYKRLTVGPMKMKEGFTVHGTAQTYDEKTGKWSVAHKRYDVENKTRKGALKTSLRHLTKEYPNHKEHEVNIEEMVNELSRATLARYVSRAGYDAVRNTLKSPNDSAGSDKYFKKALKRAKGAGMAANKMAGTQVRSFDKGVLYKMAPKISCHGGVCEVVSSMDEIKPILKEYNKDAVDKAIASSNRSGKRIGGKEAKLIHKLLSSGSMSKMTPRTNFRGDDNKVVKEDLIFEAGKKTKNSKDAMKRRYLGNLRGTTATGKPAHAIITTPTADNYKSR